LAARTRFFDRQVVAALDGGVGQVITAAAGYDARALRYARPSVRWFEVDHPDTQTDKRAAFARLSIEAHDIRFVAADFGVDDVACRLAEAGCDPKRPSLVLAEGIAAYLSIPVLTQLLDGLKRAVGAGSRLVISLSVEADSPERTARRADFHQRVAGAGEPARSTLTAVDAGSLLESTGWKADATRTEATERRLTLGFVTATAPEERPRRA
jgi:methyltransferase (TIGR00027 family)